MTSHLRDVDVVFTGLPGPLDECTFVEVEINGYSCSIGEWIHRPDGLVSLRLRCEASDAIINDPAATRQAALAAKAQP